MTSTAWAGAQLLQQRVTLRRGLRPRDVAFRIYLVALFGPPAVLLAAQLVELAAGALGVALPVTDAPTMRRLGLVLSGAGAGTLLLGVQTAAWRIPVAFAPADVTWLLASPLPRVDLLRPRLVRAFVRGAGAGAGLGAAAGVLVTDVLGGPHLAGAGLGAVAGAGLVAVAQTAAWWVVCAAGRTRAALRVSATGGVAVLVTAVAGWWWPFAGGVLVWSGPWGWPAAALLAAAGGDAGTAAAAAALTATAGAVGAWWALRAAATPPAEELARRAGVGAGAHAAVFLYDFEALLEMRRDALALLRGPPRLRLPRPRRPSAALPWRDATALLRSPGRTTLGAAAALLAGGFAALAAAAAGATGPRTGDAVVRSLALAAAAALAAQSAAGVLADPLRSAVARPFGHAHLPWRHAGLVRRHTLVPAGAFAGAGSAGAVAAALASGTPVAAWPALAGVALATPFVVAVAAHACLRPPPDPHAAFAALMTETGALAHGLRSWPSTVAFLACLAPAAALIAAAPHPPAALLVTVLAWAGAASALVWWLLARRAAPWSA